MVKVPFLTCNESRNPPQDKWRVSRLYNLTPELHSLTMQLIFIVGYTDMILWLIIPEIR
jgi:hypothetical protein